MSGNLWMFSDMLDDEDADMLRRDFITYYQGADYYGLGLKVFTRMAHEAGAIYKIGRMVLVRRDIFEEYLRILYAKNATGESDEECDSGEDDSMRQGTLVCDPKSGRMDIRFGLDEYYGGLHCGAPMEVLIDGSWVFTRLEMGEGWYLVGIDTKRLDGLTVRI